MASSLPAQTVVYAPTPSTSHDLPHALSVPHAHGPATHTTHSSSYGGSTTASNNSGGPHSLPPQQERLPSIRDLDFHYHAQNVNQVPGAAPSVSSVSPSRSSRQKQATHSGSAQQQQHPPPSQATDAPQAAATAVIPNIPRGRTQSSSSWGASAQHSAPGPGASASPIQQITSNYPYPMDAAQHPQSLKRQRTDAGSSGGSVMPSSSHNTISRTPRVRILLFYISNLGLTDASNYSISMQLIPLLTIPNRKTHLNHTVQIMPHRPPRIRL